MSRSPAQLGLVRYIVVNFLFLFPAAGGELFGQDRSSTDGTTLPIEFIGLERWTPESVLDALTEQGPLPAPVDLPIALRRLGFARASVQRVHDPTLGRTVSLVSVIEPHRSEELALREGFGPPGELPASWSETDDLFRLDNPNFLVAVGTSSFRGSDPELASNIASRRAGGVEIEAVQRVWSALDKLGPADYQAALEILKSDGDAGHRAVAAGVLVGFPGEEGAWQALMRALRDPDPRVTALANQALGPMSTVDPRTVDWAPAVGSIRALLGGANLSAFSTVLQTLVSTQVSQVLAQRLLAGNAHLVSGHISSAYSPHRDTVYRFLVKISGQDFGIDDAAWEEWLSGL